MDDVNPPSSKLSEHLLNSLMEFLSSWYTLWLFKNFSAFVGSPGDSDGKESACNTGDPGSSPGSGSSPGAENGYPIQYSCLENYMKEEPGGRQSMGLQKVRQDQGPNNFNPSRAKCPENCMVTKQIWLLCKKHLQIAMALKRWEFMFLYWWLESKERLLKDKGWETGISINQWALNQGWFCSTGDLTMSGDIFGCQNQEALLASGRCVHTEWCVRAQSFSPVTTLCDCMNCKPTRLLCPWLFPGKNNGEGRHFLL